MMTRLVDYETDTDRLAAQRQTKQWKDRADHSPLMGSTPVVFSKARAAKTA